MPGKPRFNPPTSLHHTPHPKITRSDPRTFRRRMPEAEPHVSLTVSVG